LLPGAEKLQQLPVEAATPQQVPTGAAARLRIPRQLIAGAARP